MQSCVLWHPCWKVRRMKESRCLERYALLFYCILLEEENHQEQIVEAVHHIIEICQPDDIMTVIRGNWKELDPLHAATAGDGES